MGALGSRTSSPQADRGSTMNRTGAFTPLPMDREAYESSRLECLPILLPIQIKPHRALGLQAGDPLLTSNTDDYYHAIADYLQQGYTLNTFYKVPLPHGRYMNARGLKFEAVFSRPLEATHDRQDTRLFVEKSILHVKYALDNTFSTTSDIVELSDIMKKIDNCSSTGGRLLSIEGNGEVFTHGLRAGTSGHVPGLGVDIFFEMPSHPKATARYAYRVLTIPIRIITKIRIPLQSEVHFDWSTTLASHLNGGWKLVKVFVDPWKERWSCRARARTTHSIWVLEKELSRLDDPTPVYEGAVVEYLANYEEVLEKTNWSPIIVEMGQRGWQLCCIQEMPNTYWVVKLIMIFQRKIVV